MICELSIFSSLSSRLRGSFKKTSSSKPADDCYISYINSGCIGMIKPQSTQRTQRKRTERCNSDANGFDIMQLLHHLRNHIVKPASTNQNGLNYLISSAKL